MKNKVYTIVLSVAALFIFLASCGPAMVETNYSMPLIPIEGREGLYYDPAERIVYMVIKYRADGYHGYGFMSPYYAENDALYHYNPATNTLYTLEG